jgi:hypothetical protein
MSQMLAEGAVQDLEVLIQGDRLPCTPGPALRASKWVGGLYVMFIPPIDVNDWLVAVSDGISAAGFIMSPSEDYSNPRGGAGYRNWTSMQPANRGAQVLASGATTQTLVAGGGRFMFKHFETISLDAGGARVGPAAVYTLNNKLKVSENGLLCNDPDARLLLATGGTETIFVGIVSAVPNARSGFRLGMDHKF